MSGSAMAAMPSRLRIPLEDNTSIRAHVRPPITTSPCRISSPQVDLPFLHVPYDPCYPQDQKTIRFPKHKDTPNTSFGIGKPAPMVAVASADANQELACKPLFVWSPRIPDLPCVTWCPLYHIHYYAIHCHHPNFLPAWMMESRQILLRFRLLEFHGRRQPKKDSPQKSMNP